MIWPDIEGYVRNQSRFAKWWKQEFNKNKKGKWGMLSGDREKRNNNKEYNKIYNNNFQSINNNKEIILIIYRSDSL